jgi:hypothetical protein
MVLYSCKPPSGGLFYCTREKQVKCSLREKNNIIALACWQKNANNKQSNRQRGNKTVVPATPIDITTFDAKENGVVELFYCCNLRRIASG